MNFIGYSHDATMKEDIEHITNLNSNEYSDDYNEDSLDDTHETDETNEDEMTKKCNMESKIKRKVINEVIEQLQQMLYKGDNEDIKKRHVTSAKKMIKNARKKNGF